MSASVVWTLRNIFPSVVSLAPRANNTIDVFVPKFGRLSGTVEGLHDLARWADSPVTVCLNTIYLSHDVHCGNNNANLVVHGTDNTYITAIEDVPAVVRRVHILWVAGWQGVLVRQRRL